MTTLAGGRTDNRGRYSKKAVILLLVTASTLALGYNTPPIQWVSGRERLKRDGTRAETRLRLSPKRTNPFKSAGGQFSRLLAAEVCASVVVMLDTPRSEVVWDYWLPTPFSSFPFTSPPVRHRVPPGSERALAVYKSRDAAHIPKVTV